jgi:hypothetical protein
MNVLLLLPECGSFAFASMNELGNMHRFDAMKVHCTAVLFCSTATAKQQWCSSWGLR